MAREMFKFEIQKHHVVALLGFELIDITTFDHPNANLLF